MATHSSILGWRIPWTEEPGGLQSMGYKESDTTEQMSTETLCYRSLPLPLYPRSHCRYIHDFFGNQKTLHFFQVKEK